MVNQSQFIEILNSAEKKVAIGDVLSKASKGKTPQYVEHSNVRVMNQACVHWDGMHWENVKYQDPGKLSNKEVLKSFDILLNSTGTGTLGRCNIFFNPDEDYSYIPDGHLTVLNTNPDVMRPWLLVYFIKLEDIQREIYDDCVTGSTNQVDLVRKNFLKIRIPLPEMVSQIRFDEIVAQADKSKFAGFKSQFIEETKRWSTRSTIGGLVDVNIAKAGKKFEAESTIQYIDISSVDNATNTVLGATEYIFKDAPSRAQQCIKAGDILVSTVRPNLKNIAVNHLSGDNLVASSGFCVLRPKDGYTGLLLAYILSDEFTEKMTLVAKGTNYPAVHDSDILDYEITVPEKDEVKRIDSLYRQADKSKYLN